MKTLRSSIQIAAAMLIVAGLAFTNNLSVASRSTITQETSPEELAKKSGCLECHSVDKLKTEAKETGPRLHEASQCLRIQNFSPMQISNGSWIGC